METLTNAQGRDPVVGNHASLEVRLQASTGRFYAQPAGHQVVYDKTLDGLKRRVDNIRRASLRAEAVNLPAVILDISEQWDENGRVLTATWMEGAFAGINAHTGDVRFIKKPKRGEVDGETVKVDRVWFLRADDPALPVIRRLVADRVALSQASMKAERELQKTLKQHATLPSMNGHYGRERSKTEAAARIEQQLIEFLSPNEKALAQK